MSKRELNISDKPLFNDTEEDIVFKSPSRIPPKGIQDLISLKSINSSEVAHYDIAKTELQGVRNIDMDLPSTFFYHYTNGEELRADLDIIMGEIT